MEPNCSLRTFLLGAGWHGSQDDLAITVEWLVGAGVQHVADLVGAGRLEDFPDSGSLSEQGRCAVQALIDVSLLD